MKPLIYLVVERPDGHRSEAEIEGDPVTANMLASAEDLLHTLTTGERPVLENLYETCATAFGTTRDDAKERLIAAMHGMQAPKIEARSNTRRQIFARLASTRRERNEAHAEVTSWMEAEGRRGKHHQNSEAPGWERFTRAEIAYGYAIRALEAWLDGEEIK
jgi:hypothetical protein